MSEYNFRYQQERERFYEDVVDDWDSIYQSEGAEIASGLRIVFEITDQHDEEERKGAVQSGGYKGIKVFRDLAALKRFLDSSNKYGSGIQWGKREDLEGVTNRCRISRYTRKGKRVTGEKTYKKYFIINERS